MELEFKARIGFGVAYPGLEFMSQSRILWAVKTVAPWCFASALLVSLTASAGQDTSFGGSRALLTDRAGVQPQDLVPVQQAIANGAFKLSGLPNQKLIYEAKLFIGEDAELAQTPLEIAPKRDLKRSAAVPEVDRHLKGDPFVGLRPSFDAKLRHPGALSMLGVSTASKLNALATPFTPALSAEGAYPAQGGGTGLVAGTHETPTVMIKIHTPTNARTRALQGATMSVPRAVALASTTPFDMETLPVEAVMVMPSSPGAIAKAQISVIAKTPAQPDYVAEIDPEQMKKEEKCLAQAVYFESRSEPEQGQAAVAQVVLNRSISGLYPSTICGVVFQNHSHYMACQFTFTCEGKALTINEPDAWATAQRIAKEVLLGKTYLAAVGGATHYHATYVRPYWAKSLKKMDKIGTHVFYKLKPGQT